MNDNGHKPAPSKLALAIVEAKEKSNGDTSAALLKVANEFPNVSQAEFDAALDEAIEIFKAQAREMEAEAAALDRLAPLFDGMPESMPLGECARIKAERGDPLAIEYLKWEAATYSGPNPAT